MSSQPRKSPPGQFSANRITSVPTGYCAVQAGNPVLKQTIFSSLEATSANKPHGEPAVCSELFITAGAAQPVVRVGLFGPYETAFGRERDARSVQTPQGVSMMT